jgi:D-aminoacyl-tRNA deacylase
MTQNTDNSKRIAILCSSKDVASQTLFNVLTTHPYVISTADISMIQKYPQSEDVKTYNCVIKDSLISHSIDIYITTLRHVSEIPRQISSANYDLVIFLSKHASVSGKPSFCIHTQGNFGAAELGGSPHNIAICPLIFKNTYYQNIFKINQDMHIGFDVVHEATHHGPDCDVPSVFVEVGSTVKEWQNSIYAQYVIDALIKTLQEYKGEIINYDNIESQKIPPSIFGIGGSHTCTNFNRLSREGKALLGHVCANYNIFDLKTADIDMALKRSTRSCDIIVDWKSLDSAQRQHITTILTNYSWKKLKTFKEQVDEEIV